jgi:hypothetical protein
MNRIILGACTVLTASLCCWSAAVSAAEGERDIGSEARSIFSARCAGCHGPSLPKPKGRFGYVLDLARVAANPEMVIPLFADESELWELVRRGEMPPDDSPTGPLSGEEKEVIRAWIAAGAPANSQKPASTSPAPASERPAQRANTTVRGGQLPRRPVSPPGALKRRLPTSSNKKTSSRDRSREEVQNL